MPYVVTAEVKSIKGKCHYHKVGDKAEFIGNEVKGRICHFALHSIYPIALGLEFGATYPWSKDPATLQACPDPLNLVVFEIKRGRKLTDGEVETLYGTKPRK